MAHGPIPAPISDGLKIAGFFGRVARGVGEWHSRAECHAARIQFYCIRSKGWLG